MRKRLIALLMMTVMMCMTVMGCGSSGASEKETETTRFLTGYYPSCVHSDVRGGNQHGDSRRRRCG